MINKSRIKLRIRMVIEEQKNEKTKYYSVCISALI